MADQTLPAVGTFDSLAKCQKCGHDDIATTYHDAEERYISGIECAAVRLFETRWVAPHLCRRCTRCGFKWPELTIDHHVETGGREAGNA